jgi:hypothetical protein
MKTGFTIGEAEAPFQPYGHPSPCGGQETPVTVQFPLPSSGETVSSFPRSGKGPNVMSWQGVYSLTWLKDAG